MQYFRKISNQKPLRFVFGYKCTANTLEINFNIYSCGAGYILANKKLNYFTGNSHYSLYKSQFVSST